MVNHTISHADQVYFSDAYNAGLNKNDYAKRGIEWTPMFYADFGTPSVADADEYIAGATSTEAPNASTVTHGFATGGGSSPLDGDNQTGVLADDEGLWGRNVTVAVNATGSAWSATITGTDYLGATVVETIAVAANALTGVGAKAFKTISTVALTSTGNMTSNTINVGMGSAFGLPYYIDDKNRVIIMFDGNIDAGTVVAGVTATATATTGDVRGTVTATGTLNGSKSLGAMVAITRPTTDALVFGVPQYAG